MSSKKKLVLHSYDYDPLDRHVKSGAPGNGDTQLFYCNARVATEIKGDTAYRVFETEDVVLGQQTHKAGAVDTTLIAHDDKRSTLATLNDQQHTAIAYTVAGYSASDEQRVLGFNGERSDKNTGYYLLGNGYRAFNPVLMRFNSPDSWSPFGKGGINAYAYCNNNWPNLTDPSGHAFRLIKSIANLFGRTKSVTEILSGTPTKLTTTHKSIYVFKETGTTTKGKKVYEILHKLDRKKVNYKKLKKTMQNKDELSDQTVNGQLEPLGISTDQIMKEAMAVEARNKIAMTNATKNNASVNAGQRDGLTTGSTQKTMTALRSGTQPSHQ